MVSRAHDEAVAERALFLPRAARGPGPPWVAGALVSLPAAVLALVDWLARHEQIASWPRGTIAGYVGTLVLSGALWGALVTAAAARDAWGVRALLVLFAALAVGGQIYFFGRYHAYMNPRAVLVGTSMLPSVGQQLWSDRSSFVRALLSPVALALVVPMALARSGRMPLARARMALDAALIALLAAGFGVEAASGGEEAASPDVLVLSSLGRLAHAFWKHDDPEVRSHPGPRSAVPVPPIAGRGDRGSVVLIVSESVRAADACGAPTAGCATTPFTNALLPDRFGFTQMRSLDSTTAVSLAVLWAGLKPTASREQLHKAPLLWEYAHAAGFDTGYWTSQNLLFANAGKWLEGLPISRFVSATDLAANPTYELGADDAKLVDVVLHDLPAMHAPFVAVVHLSNTHFPYLIDEADAPFQPQSGVFGAGDGAKVHNRYDDAIHRQDFIVARLVRGLRAMPGGDRTVVAFISDHGEQIRERGAIGHTWGVYDEEVRVPFWIDAPRGALTDSQAAALRSLRDVPLTQLDVLPTLLDLLGIWDAPQVAPLRRAMAGDSLLRGGTPNRPVVLTNCTSIFACAFKNWGAMRGTRKLVAAQSDTAWKCFDVAVDPGEKRDLGPAACGDLRELAEGDGRGAPF